MLEYVCFLKLKDDVGEEGHKVVRQYLEELPKRVGWLRSWTWGEALGTVGEPCSYTFTAEFDDMEALEGYLAHRDRQIIEKRLAPFVADTVAAYFEVPPGGYPERHGGEGVFRQITMVKVKPDAPPGKVDEIVEELSNLGKIVPDVKRAQVVKITDNPAWDMVFMWEFENREGHQRYIRHPYHGPMDERIRPYFESFAGIRYDVEPGDPWPPVPYEPKPVMIKYVALMKMRDDTPQDKLKEIEAQLKALGKDVPDVESWSCGRCLDSHGPSTNWTFAVIADFRDTSAYQRYREHPQHRAFGELIAPYREKSLGMHYEANYPYMGLIKHVGGAPKIVPLPWHRLPPLEE